MPQIHFTERGSGKPVVLIHGFPFNQELWTDFAEALSTSCKVWTIDLPGFGESPLLKTPFTLTDVAKELNAWLDESKISQPVIVGHSLGGYVALAMAELNPESLSGLVLFHSTALPDNEEKKQNRDKVLDFIAKNGVSAFTSNFIPPLFADSRHPAIEEVQKIASQAGEDVVRAYTIAMRDRKDQTPLLKVFHKPVMIISGEKDGGIPIDSVRKQSRLSDAIELYVLGDVGHMGMFENRDKCQELIRRFVYTK